MKEKPIDIENSYNKGIPVIWVLVLFFFIPSFLKIMGFFEDIPLIITVMPAMMFLLIQIIAVIMAWNRTRKIIDFLSSERAVVKWVYSFEESKKIRKERYKDNKDDFKLIFVGATFIFGLCGLITGIMPDMNFLLCFSIGLGFGASVGLIIGYGTKIQNERDYKSNKFIQVGLGVEEIFYKDEYFKVKKSGFFERCIILNVSFDKKTDILSIITKTDRHRHHAKSEWIIKVPREQIEKVEAFIPKIKVRKEDNNESFDEEELEEEKKASER